MKITVEDLVTDTFSCPFFFRRCLFFSTCDYVFLLCNIVRAGLDVVGGVRRDLRVQSYHVFYLIVSLRFTVVSVFKLFFFFFYAFCPFRSACSLSSLFS